MKTSNNKILITGGATGIGLGLAERFLKENNTVIIIEMIPPALNTDLGAKGIHDGHPSVSEFVASVFAQMQEGKNELTFGSSKDRAEANNKSISEYFSKLNP